MYMDVYICVAEFLGTIDFSAPSSVFSTLEKAQAYWDYEFGTPSDINNPWSKSWDGNSIKAWHKEIGEEDGENWLSIYKRVVDPGYNLPQNENISNLQI